MRATTLVILAACGGSDGGGGAGTLEASVDLDGARVAFSESCDLTESETYFEVVATNDTVGFEIKWRKALIAAPGTYPTGGIVDDIVMFAMKGEAIFTATGSTTFTTYGAPDVVTGTFDLAATGITASGAFDCR